MKMPQLKTKRSYKSDDLFDAISKFEFKKIKKIIACNSNLLHSRNYIGQTPLDIAVKSGYITLAEFFLEKGADINADTNKNANPFLLEAIYKDNIPMVELLIRYANNDPSFIHTLKNKSIFKAKSVKMAEFLIQHGANINAVRDDEENTIAHTFWSSYNNLKLTKFLLKQGLDLTVKNRNGLTAVEYCRSLLIEDDIPKLIQKYDRNRTEIITLMVSAFIFDENSLINKDNIGKDMFLLIMGSLK